MLNRMIKRVAQLRISTKFHFTGFLKGDDVDTMFAMSDVYVMPSVSEPFGFRRWKPCVLMSLLLFQNNQELQKY